MKTFVLILFFSTFCANAQAVKLIQGEILNDRVDIVGITIVNTSLKAGTVTNAEGIFYIKAQKGDTLHISAVSYESRELVINEPSWKKGMLSFYLHPKVNELDEVFLSNSELSGNLQKDMASVVLKKTTIDPRELGLPANARPIMNLEERRYYGATSGAGPVGMLINAISGRTKMLKKHLETSRLEAIVQKNKSKFSTSFYVDNLQIPKELIEDFVFYIFEDPKVNRYLRKEAILELLEFMQEKATLYLELKKTETAQKPN